MDMGIKMYKSILCLNNKELWNDKEERPIDHKRRERERVQHATRSSPIPFSLLSFMLRFPAAHLSSELLTCHHMCEAYMYEVYLYIIYILCMHVYIYIYTHIGMYNIVHRHRYILCTHRHYVIYTNAHKDLHIVYIKQYTHHRLELEPSMQ